MKEIRRENGGGLKIIEDVLFIYLILLIIRPKIIHNKFKSTATTTRSNTQ
jgi:hypothetical protein